MSLIVLSDFLEKEREIEKTEKKGIFSVFSKKESSKKIQETRGEKKFLRKLQEAYLQVPHDVFLYVQPQLEYWDKEYSLRPDFILLDPQRGMIIFEVKDWSTEGIQTIGMHHCAIRGIRGSVKNPFSQVNAYRESIIKRLKKRGITVSQELLENGLPVLSYAVFPNMIDSEIKKHFHERYKGKYIAKNHFNKIAPFTLFKNKTISFCEDDYIKNIKIALFPELEVHNSSIHFTAYNSSIKILDREQEQIAKRIPKGHFKLTGVPGSGKTIIVMARAIYLLKQNPTWKIKILTYNTQLKNTLEKMLEEKTQSIREDNFDPLNISIDTIHSLARRISEVKIPEKKTKDFWKTELIEKALEKAEPEYDAVFVDEYQDFEESWIRLALKICKKDIFKNEENFFLAGDRVQSIYNKNGEPTWKHLGVNIVGKTKFLRTPYRSKHIRFALRILAENSNAKKEIIENYENFSEIPKDEKQGIHFLSEKNTSSLVSILSEFQKNMRDNLEEMMILVPGRKESNALKELLPSSLTKDINFVASQWGRYKNKSIPQKNKILVTTYHSAKGMESKDCILLNVEKLFTKKDTEKFAENLVFVGVTRASENLYIHGNSSSEIFQKMKNFS